MTQRLLLSCIIVMYVCLLSVQAPQASSLSGAVQGLKADQAGSAREMKTVVNILYSCFTEAKERGELSFDLQKLIITKAGDCVGKIADFSQKALYGGHTIKEEMKDLFEKNGAVLREILSFNQGRVRYFQEEKLDGLKDPAPFFASAEWQEPQYLISLASYWLSWNDYYSSLLYDKGEARREELLEEGTGGFAGSFLDFKEEAIVVRSLFGRALCYKEMGAYDKALQDISSVIVRIKRDDSLYVRSRYERAMVSYLTGNYEPALQQLIELEEDLGQHNIAPAMQDSIGKLKTKIAFALLKKKAAAHEGAGTLQYYREALKVLAVSAADSDAQAVELYRFVADHADLFSGFTEAELGSMGTLAVADRDFDRKKYDMAAERYGRLTRSGDRALKKRMDEVLFRLGYCLCEQEQWEEALTRLESFFKSFPGSSLAGKAACLYYVAAARTYNAKPSDGTFSRYVRAIECYLHKCSDPRDKDNAYFQLGKYYQQKGNPRKAGAQFARVGKASPHYPAARYALIVEGLDGLEALDKKGSVQTSEAQKIYARMRASIEEYRKLVAAMPAGAGRKELEARTAIRAARLALHGGQESQREALRILTGFESRFPATKEMKRLHRMAKRIRLECFLSLQMVREAEAEIDALMGSGAPDQAGCDLLMACADRFYDAAKASCAAGSSSCGGWQAKAAIVMYEKLAGASALSRHLESIRLRIADLSADTGRTDRAITLYQKVLSDDPDSADAVYSLGRIYQQEGKWEEALAAWRKLSTGLKAGGYYWFEARYGTALALKELNRPKEACEVITMTEVLHPDLRDEAFKACFLKLKDEVCEKGPRETR